LFRSALCSRLASRSAGGGRTRCMSIATSGPRTINVFLPNKSVAELTAAIDAAVRDARAAFAPGGAPAAKAGCVSFTVGAIAMVNPVIAELEQQLTP
jgi:hypothetical protein